MIFDIEMYETDTGKCQVKDFILSADKKMKARILWSIDLLAQHGNELREPYSKSIEDGIFELRIKQGSDISRIMYFFFVGGKIVLTNGFIKKTQKTPSKEIEKAKSYRNDYLRRNTK